MNNIPEVLIKDLTEAESELFLKTVEEWNNSRSRQINNGILLQDGYKIRINDDGSVTKLDEKGKAISSSIDDLFYLLDNIFKNSIKINPKKWMSRDEKEKLSVNFSMAYQEKEPKTPSITYRVISGQPGAFGRGPENSPTTRQRDKILIESVSDPNDINNQYYIFNSSSDFHIEISTYGKTPEEADKVRRWVEDSIQSNIWYLKYSGIRSFFFSQRLSDNKIEIGEDIIHQRTLKYFVMINELSWTSLQKLRQLILTVRTGG